MRRAGHEERVLSDDRLARFDGFVESALGFSNHRRQLAVHVPIRVESFVDVAVVDAHHTHACHAVDDLVRQASCHEPGADDANPDRASLFLSRPERCIDKNHGVALIAICMRDRSSDSAMARAGHRRSFSEITVTGSGQVSPRRGSSNSSPPSAPGVELTNLVRRLRVIFEGLVPMGKAFGDEDPTMIVGTKLDTHVVEVGR